MMDLLLVDSHAHLAEEEFDQDRAEALRRARAAGVGLVVSVGFDAGSSRRAMELAEREATVFAAVGFHPDEAASVTEESYQELSRWCRHPKVKAVGEIGLDYYWNRAPKPVQSEVFRRQIAIARECGLPIVVHDRDAHADTVSLLREEARDVGGVMHCFSGDEEVARQCLDLGFYISLAGPVTFKNGQMAQAVARMVPEDRLLVETDSPYLAPVPYRGRRNEPAHVRLVAEAIASLRGVSLEQLAAATTANAKRLFGLT